MRFLDGRIGLAPGAVLLARRTGAALLPAFAFRDPEAGLVVTVAPPIEVADGGATAQAIRQAAGDYARVLAPYVSKYPGQWKGWRQI